MPWNDKKLRPKPCLGRQLIKARNHGKIGCDSVSTSQRHTEELDDGLDFASLNLRDVDKDTDMNKFLETAAAAAENYEDVQRDIKLVDTSRYAPKVTAPEGPPRPSMDTKSTATDETKSVTAEDLKSVKSESLKTIIDTKPTQTKKFEDKLNKEFFAPPMPTLHFQGTGDLPPTLPPKGWKKAARSNKHVKTKRMYPRE